MYVCVCGGGRDVEQRIYGTSLDFQLNFAMD